MQQLLEPELVDLVDRDEQQLVVGRRDGLELLGDEQLGQLEIAAVGQLGAVLAEVDVDALPTRRRSGSTGAVVGSSEVHAVHGTRDGMIGAWTLEPRSTTRPRSCEQAYALVVDPEFRAAVCEATHAIDYNVEIEEHDDGGAHVVVDRTVPADVPDMMKKFVGETIGVKQTEDWGPPAADGSRTADLLLEIKGQPAKLTGTITLAAPTATDARSSSRAT